MNNPNSPKPTITKSAHVATVVQEYMDTLLVDLFPDVSTETAAASNLDEKTALDPQVTVVNELTVADIETAPEPVIETVKLEIPKPVPAPIDVKPVEKIAATPAPDEVVESKSQIIDELKPKPKELRYPLAPEWAQEAFEVLLFDVCGLKLAVPMEALGKIIKVEHETNQLIGRPNWFIGAYIDHEQHLYVVDTAKYIMPEKGFDLAEGGFDYVIQLQRSKWSLACKKVHSTVRLQPDQVKWRSQQGKRQWLSGTVVDHMCALIHVDSLITLLEAEAK
ncbi:MAG: purine-binding chemotaxis protein CheW [Oceanicoccus sp.]|jgi:purine-binding chemotaxis protein CheW